MKTLEELAGVKKKAPSLEELAGVTPTTKPIKEKPPEVLTSQDLIEPNEADLDIYRRMGLKEYVSPSGKRYTLTQQEIPDKKFTGIGLGPLWDEPGDTRTMKEILNVEPWGAKEILTAIREMVAPTTPYTEKEAIQAYEEIPRVLENVGVRVLTLGGLAGPLMGLKPSELRAALKEDLEDKAAFAPAFAPALGETTLLAVEWGYIYPKLFKLVGAAPHLIARIPKVAKGAKALKSLGGIEKVAEKYPRLYARSTRGLVAFTKGATVGAIRATPEALGEEMPSGLALKHISKNAAILGGVAFTFQAVSEVDTALYISKLRNTLLQASNREFAGYLAKVEAMPDGVEKSAAYNSLSSLKRIELGKIDQIVSAKEAELLGLKSNKLYQKGQEVVEKPELAAQRLMRHGIEQVGELPAGVESLKKGLGKAGPFIKMPMTRTAEAIETAKELGKVIRKPSKLLRPKAPPPPKPVTPPPVRAPITEVTPPERPEIEELVKEEVTTKPVLEKPDVGTIENINVVGMADYLKGKFQEVKERIDNTTLKKWVSDAFGVSPGDLRPEIGYSHKKVQEAMESAIVQIARGIVEENRGDPEETYKQLRELYDRQPTLVARTDKTIAGQAYSTPVPLAFVASELAGIDENTIVWEPTAGTGMLTIGADPKNVAVNELDPTRAEILKSQGFLQVFEYDARKVYAAELYDAVIMNPPFGIHDEVRYDDFKLSRIEHIIAAENLKAMKDDGMGVMIIAAPKVMGEYSRPDWVFGNYIYSHYNVIGDFEVSGDLYQRQGAAWPVRVITVAGRKISEKYGPKSGIFRAKTWEDVYNRMERIKNAYPSLYPAAREKREGVKYPGRREPERPEVVGPVREPTAEPTEPAGERPARPSRPGKLPAEREPAERGPAERPGRLPAGEREVHPERPPEPSPTVPERKPPRKAEVEEERPERPELTPKPTAPRVEKRKPVGVVRAALGKLQTPYKPASKAPPTNENIPTYLQSHVAAALDNLQKNVGDIDEYVREQLQYKSKEQMWEHLSGSQVDSIALTLDRLDKGSALIVGHQTGVGKGRIGAAIVRREILNDRKPVFFTAKGDLFSDFYRDLIDVGLTEKQLQPLMMNAKVDIKDQLNMVVFEKHGNRANANTAIRKALRDKDYNLVLTTYSQINTETRHQRAQLAELVRGNVLILDESHNAAGESKTGDFIKDVLIAHSSGVLFSSATYAKNPKTMMLYARTGLLEAFDGDVDNMLNAVQMGGEPYQEVIAAALARANSYIRTELDFSGVSYETTIDARHLDRDTERADKVTEVLRNIVAFDNAFSAVVIDPKQKQAKAQAKRTKSVGTTIGHTNFAAVAHNAIKQMLLALKIDESVDMAKQALKQGKKPIIALENTMGSFLERYVDQHGLSPGAKIKDFDYRAALMNMLTNVLKYREVSAYGDEEVIWVSVEELTLDLQDAYHALEDHIKEMELDLPGSPIDEIISQLEDAGYKVGEITGRHYRLIKTGKNEYELSVRSAAEKNKTDIAYQFNNKDMDALVVNVAGAEGMSIHASEKFKNKQKRQMIVAQSHADINKFVQVLGRINRKGQVVNPEYKILMTALPAEIRPAAILENKMRSLNANTSAKTKGAYEQKEIPDILNLYGDYIVAQYIINNPEILRQTGLDIELKTYQNSMADGNYHGPWHSDNIARKFTGRAALLKTEEQNEFYEWAEPEYTRLLEYLNKTDQNELVSTDKNYKAKEVTTKQIFVGEPGNVFQEPATLDKMSVVMEGRPMTTDEMKDEIQEVVQKAGHETTSEYMEDIRKKLDAAWERYVEQKGKKKVKQASVEAYSRADSLMLNIRLGGKRVDGERNPVILLEVINTFDKEKFIINPAAPSNIQLRVAIPHPARTVIMSLSQFANMGYHYGNVDKYFNIPADQREERYVANGNIIAAMGVIVGDSEKRKTQIRPKVINYTMEDGSLRQGLLLPKTYNPSYDLPTSVNMIPEAAAAYLMDGYRGQRHLKIGEARIFKAGDNSCYIEVPKSKARGLKYFGDAGLKKIVGDFETYRQAMRADFSSDRLANALVYLKSKGNAIKSDDDDADTAREYNNAHRDVPESDEYGMAEVKKPAIKLKREAAKPVKKPVSNREIIQYLSKALGVPIRGVATFRKKKPGWYNKRTRGVRLKNVSSLRVACHEVGHHIDSYINNEAAKKMSHAWYGIGAELVKLGKALYGKKRPEAGYKAEGYAEFLFGWLTEGIDLKKEAPKMLRFFENDYLKDNPEIADILHTAKDMIENWKDQGAVARFDSQIGQKIKPSKGWRERYSLWIQTGFTDVSAPLQRALQENIPSRNLMFGEKDPGMLYHFFAQTEGARARTMVMVHTTDLWGNVTGKSLQEVLKPISDRIKDFIRYIVAARAINLEAREINSGFDYEDAVYIFQLYDSPQWRKVAEEVTEWNHRILDYLVQAGALEEEAALKMRELNPIYAPFLRTFAPDEKRRRPKGVGRGLIKRGKGVYKIIGTERGIEEPLESMITQTRRMISIAHKSVIARAFVELATKYEGLAGMIERVPPPLRATTFDASQLKKQLISLGIDVAPGDLDDAMFTVFSNSPVFLGKEHIISVVVEGKRQWYEISPELYRILEDLDQFQLPKLLNLLFGKLTRLCRLGATGINASFGLIFNPIRDILDTVPKAKYARGPIAFAKGIAKDLSRTGLTGSLDLDTRKAAQRFNDIGGKISGYLGQDRTSIQHLRGEMLANTVKGKAIHTIRHPVEAMRAVIGVPESGLRIEEYDKAMQDWMQKHQPQGGEPPPDAIIYAFSLASDQTINYRRAGLYGRWLNSMIAFWNANMQDISKVYRTFSERPKQTMLWGIAALTLPALGLWWLNKDEEWYKELPSWEKANYIHIPVYKEDEINYIIRLPVPFLMGHIFMSMPVTVVDTLYTQDPEKINDFLGEVYKADIKPLFEWPTAISPYLDIRMNKDWAGRPVIPESVKGKLPEDQYKEYTTEFCKVLAKLWNKIPGSKKVAPLQLEYALNSYSGGLYRRIAKAAEIVGGYRGKELTRADRPLIGRLFVRDPYAPKHSIEKFYDELDRLNRMYQSKKIKPQSPLAKKRSLYNQTSRIMSPLWDRLQKSKTIADRKKIYGRMSKQLENLKEKTK